MRPIANKRQFGDLMRSMQAAGFICCFAVLQSEDTNEDYGVRFAHSKTRERLWVNKDTFLDLDMRFNPHHYKDPVGGFHHPDSDADPAAQYE